MEGFTFRVSDFDLEILTVEGGCIGEFKLKDHGPFAVKVSMPEECSGNDLTNLAMLMKQLPDFILEVVSWADSIRSQYDCGSEPYDAGAELEFSIPAELITEAKEWSVWLHEGNVGWLVDLEGFRPVGGQGVF